MTINDDDNERLTESSSDREELSLNVVEREGIAVDITKEPVEANSADVMGGTATPEEVKVLSGNAYSPEVLTVALVEEDNVE